MKKQKIEKRFAGALSEEFALNELVWPYQRKTHELVGQILKDFYKKSGKINCLEIGCGTGVTTQAIIDANPNFEVIALDSSNQMIEQAKHNLDSRLLKFVESDVLEYLSKKKSESIDAVASAYTIHNFKNDYREKVLKEIYRVIKPRGIFVNADIVYYSEPKKQEKQFDFLAKQVLGYDSIGRPDLSKKWMKHISEDRESTRILIDKEFTFQLNKIGFRSIERRFRYHSDAVYTALK